MKTMITYRNCIGHKSQEGLQLHTLSPREQAHSSALLSLSHHEVSGPSGKEQSTKQHSVAEENEFENFPECPEESD